jgi:hypothetical protein
LYKIQAILSPDNKVFLLILGTLKNPFPVLVEGIVRPFTFIICTIREMLCDGAFFGTTWECCREFFDQPVELLQQVFYVLFLLFMGGCRYNSIL